jgi:hypothetical protein
VLDRSWVARAACRGRTDVDFTAPQDAPRALTFCAACPVRLDCLRYALSLDAVGTIGVWGGHKLFGDVGTRARLRRVARRELERAA